jgi:hypothetical protein
MHYVVKMEARFGLEAADEDFMSMDPGKARLRAGIFWDLSNEVGLLRRIASSSASPSGDAVEHGMRKIQNRIDMLEKIDNEIQMQATRQLEAVAQAQAKQLAMKAAAVVEARARYCMLRKQLTVQIAATRAVEKASVAKEETRYFTLEDEDDSIYGQDWLAVGRGEGIEHANTSKKEGEVSGKVWSELEQGSRISSLLKEVPVTQAIDKTGLKQEMECEVLKQNSLFVDQILGLANVIAEVTRSAKEQG